MTQLNQELGRFVKDEVVDPLEAWLKAADKADLVKVYEGLSIAFEVPED